MNKTFFVDYNSDGQLLNIPDERQILDYVYWAKIRTHQ